MLEDAIDPLITESTSFSANKIYHLHIMWNIWILVSLESGFEWPQLNGLPGHLIYGL